MNDQRIKCLSVIASCYGQDLSLSAMTRLFGQIAGTVGLESISITSNMLGIDCYMMEATVDVFERPVKAPLLIELEKDYYVVVLPGKAVKGSLRLFDPMIGHVHVSIERLRGRFLSMSGTFNMIAYEEPRKDTKVHKDVREVSNLSSLQVVLLVFTALIMLVVNAMVPYLLKLMVDNSFQSGIANVAYTTMAEVLLFCFLGVLAAYIGVNILSKYKVGKKGIEKSGLGFLVSIPPFVHRKMIQSVEYALHNYNQNVMQNTRSKYKFYITSLNVLFLPILLFIYSKVCFAVLSVSIFVQIILQLKYADSKDVAYEELLSKEQNSSISNWAAYNNDLDLYKYYKNKDIDVFNNSSAIFTKRDNFFLGVKQYLQLATQLTIVFFLHREMLQGLTPGALLACIYIIMRLTLATEDILSLLKENTYLGKVSQYLSKVLHQVKRIYSEDRVKRMIPEDKSIHMLSVSSTRNPVLGIPAINNVNISIKQDSFVIVTGQPGSGKSTLLQLLVKRMEPANGDIIIGDISKTDIPGNSLVYKYYKKATEEYLRDNPDCIFLRNVDPDVWYSMVGYVSPDGVILNDTIAANIAVNEMNPDFNRVRSICEITGFASFIDTLATGIQTNLGEDGFQLSEGQRMLLLLCRAIYKSPMYLLFDDSFCSLDEITEKELWKNLRAYLKNTTIIIATGRSALGSDADKIILLENGCIAEQGTYDELIRSKGRYYEYYKFQN